jgi:hypothetical protein
VDAGRLLLAGGNVEEGLVTVGGRRSRIRAIERELEAHFDALCLDNRPERMKLAAWIADRDESTTRPARRPIAAVPSRSPRRPRPA